MGILAKHLYPVTPRTSIPCLLAKRVEPAGACNAIRAQETKVYIAILHRKTTEYTSAWQGPKKDDKSKVQAHEAQQKGGRYRKGGCKMLIFTLMSISSSSSDLT